jgi:hypothetical protein
VDEDEHMTNEPLADLRWADRRSPGKLLGVGLGLGIACIVTLVAGLVGVGDPDGLPIWAGVLLLLALALGASSVGVLLGAFILVMRRGVRGRAHTRPIVSWGPPGSRPEKGAEPVPHGATTDAARAREQAGPTPF